MVQKLEDHWFSFDRFHVLGLYFEVGLWDTAGQLASAYKLGRAESNAAINLLNHIDALAVDGLTSLVKFFDLY